MGGNGYHGAEAARLAGDPAQRAKDVLDAALRRIAEDIEIESGEGVVEQVMGPVVDVAFTGEMPPLGNLLRVGDRERGIPLEAVQLLGGGILRPLGDCRFTPRRARAGCRGRSG